MGLTDALASVSSLIPVQKQGVIPPSPTERKHCQEHSGLQAINGTPIATSVHDCSHSKRFHEHGMVINPRKCLWSWSSWIPRIPGGQPRHKIPGRKVQVIRDFPQPTTQRKLHEFLGLVNYYYRFIPGCADILHPINNLLPPLMIAPRPYPGLRRLLLLL